MLVVQNIKKSYPNKKVAINNCSLTIDKNCIFGLLGENGAGKSTLLRIIAGVLKADEGTLLFDNEVIFENEKNKEKIIFISEDIRYGMSATLKSMKEFYKIFYPKFNETRYRELLQIFELDELKPINSFSKGMRRQATIILGLAVEAELYLMDEIFDGLDLKVRFDLKRYLIQLFEEHNFTVILSSHNLNELENLCDEVAILQNGEIKVHEYVDRLKSTFFKLNVVYQDKLVMKLPTVYHESNGRIQTFVLKSEENMIRDYIEQQDIIFYEILPCTLEEVFVYEMKGELRYE